jgi:hypothetical protein
MMQTDRKMPQTIQNIENLWKNGEVATPAGVRNLCGNNDLQVSNPDFPAQ